MKLLYTGNDVGRFSRLGLGVKAQRVDRMTNTTERSQNLDPTLGQAQELCCRICGNSESNVQYQGSERQFGFGGSFLYFQCASCGCLQLATVPADLSPYYPPHYYSYRLYPLPQHGLKSWLARRRDFELLTGRRGIVSMLDRWSPVRLEMDALARLPLSPSMSILDVGCGRGQLLSRLWRAGFKDVLGADPYLLADNEVVPGLWVRKLSLSDIDRHFDLIMLHHVFEHVEDGLKMLADCRTRLKPQGRILVRIPTIDGEAWRRYGVHWVGLDAPRHLFLHGRSSFERLARQARLQIVDWRSEEASFHYWGSELYQRGLPTFDAQGNSAQPNEHFNAEQMARFSEQSRTACQANRGDQVAIILAPCDKSPTLTGSAA